MFSMHTNVNTAVHVIRHAVNDQYLQKLCPFDFKLVNGDQTISLRRGEVTAFHDIEQYIYQRTTSNIDK